MFLNHYFQTFYAISVNINADVLHGTQGLRREWALLHLPPVLPLLRKKRGSSSSIDGKKRVADFKLIQRFVLVHQIMFWRKKIQFSFLVRNDYFEEEILWRSFLVCLWRWRDAVLEVIVIELSVVGKRIDGKTLLFAKVCELLLISVVVNIV